MFNYFETKEEDRKEYFKFDYSKLKPIEYTPKSGDVFEEIGGRIEALLISNDPFERTYLNVVGRVIRIPKIGWIAKESNRCFGLNWRGEKFDIPREDTFLISMKHEGLLVARKANGDFMVIENFKTYGTNEEPEILEALRRAGFSVGEKLTHESDQAGCAVFNIHGSFGVSLKIAEISETRHSRERLFCCNSVKELLEGQKIVTASFRSAPRGDYSVFSEITI